MEEKYSRTYLNQSHMLGVRKNHNWMFTKSHLKKLVEHFCEKINIVLERHKFFCSSQGQNEKVVSYIAALRWLSATCDFGPLTDSLIRDQLVKFTNDSKIQEKLLGQNPDLSEAIYIAKRIEHTALCDREIKESNESLKVNTNVNNISNTNDVYKVRGIHMKKQKVHSGKFKCFRCGNSYHLANSPKCPA